MTPRYRAFNDAMRERFGCKVYRLAVDGGMTCPNRDGTLGTGGCTFCTGAAEFSEQACGSVAEQLERAKERVRHKNRDGRYIAYFQSFTNTYAPVPVLERLFREAIEPDDIAALSVATRPDCLPPEVLRLLAALRREKPVWVELGLQTVHERTALAVRRGYPLPVFDDAVSRLKGEGIEVIAHMILGLPGENTDDMAATARHIGAVGADGIKLQLLHILEGTQMAADWRAGRVPVLEREAYFAALAKCLSVLPPEMIVHRLTGDGDKRTLLAPLWSADKKRVLNAMRLYFEEHDVRQGSAL